MLNSTSPGQALPVLTVSRFKALATSRGSPEEVQQIRDDHIGIFHGCEGETLTSAWVRSSQAVTSDCPSRKRRFARSSKISTFVCRLRN